MISSKPIGLLIVVIVVLVGGCQSGSDSDKKSEKESNLVLGKMEVQNGWARPGSKGQASAAYVTITNGTASADTLTNAHSPAAEKARLHKSTTNEQGISTMRPAGLQPIKAGKKLQLSPGGFHLMLMKLHHDLAVGDSVSVMLDFAHAGKKQLKIPVRLQE